MRKILILLAICFNSILCFSQINDTVSIHDVEIKDMGEYVQIGDEHILVSDSVSNPSVPAVEVCYAVPLDAENVTIETSIISSDTLVLTKPIYPVQPPRAHIEDSIPFVNPNPDIYASSALYPNVDFRIKSDERIMGYRVIRVAYYPIIYNPQSQMIYNRNLNVNIGYTSANGVYFNAPKASENRKRIATQFIKGLVKNKHDIEQQTSSNSRARNITNNQDLLNGEKVPDYIIITNEELKPAFQRLADWKTQKGVPTIIRTIESIDAEYSGGDLVDKIKNYLDDFASKWGDEGLYVLLGGDSEIVPTREVASDYSSIKEIMATDAFLVEKELKINWGNKKVTNKNSTRNILIGRIPLNTIEEVNLFITNLLRYEKAPLGFNYQYINNALFVKGYMKDNAVQGYMEEIDSFRTRFFPSNKKYWYLFDHFNCPLDDHEVEDYDTSCGDELNKNNFIAALNGRLNLGYPHLIFHSDHSQTMRLGLSERDKGEGLDNRDIYRLDKHPFLNIIISTGCHPANFIGDCIAENFLKKNTIAFIGNTDVGWRDEYPMFGTILKNLYSNSLQASPTYSLGFIHFQMMHNGMTGNKHRCHILGDPEMSVWTDVPSDLNVAITPDSISGGGGNSISVQLHNLPSTHQANICIMKDTEVYFTSTIDDTNAHEYTFTPKTSGDLTVTITAHNFRPVVKTIPVQINDDRAVVISEIEDFDGMVYSSQQVELNIKLKNVGDTELSNVTAELTTSSPYITISNNSVSYGDILPNLEKTGQSPFAFNVSRSAPSISREDFNATCFYLTVKDSSQNIVGVDTFKVDIKTSEIVIQRLYIQNTSNNDNILEPLEKVYVKIDFLKRGIIKESDVILTIEPKSHSYVDSLEIKSLYEWSFRLNQNYTKGKVVLFDIGLYHKNIIVDSIKRVSFGSSRDRIYLPEIFVEQEPNSIAIAYGMDRFCIDEIYHSSYIDGPYEKINDNVIASNYFVDYDPYPINYYKISFLDLKRVRVGISTPIKACTRFATELFPPRYLSGSMSAYIHPPTTYDIDYDGTKDLVLMARYDNSKEGRAVVLNDDGTEPYDIDNDGDRFLNGFAKLPWSSCEATPVVADIYNNGEPCLISVTRNNSNKTENYIVCVSSMDKNNDGVPDTLWTKQLSNPYYRSAIATDIDYPDGENKKEIILLSTDGGTIKILDCNGNLKYNLSSLSNGTYNMPAVADLNNDGYKEIVCTDANGVYIWQYDSCSYNKTCIFSSPSSSIELSSSPVICDLNKNGVKDIIVASNRASRSYIYAIDANSNLLDGFPVSISYSGATGAGLDHQVTVGDINNDGYLEIVALGTDSVKAWNKSGELIFGRRFKGLLPNTNYSVNMTEPLLADVDGDSIPDIIFYLDEKVYVLANEGNDVEGFPIITKKERLTGLSISDIDNDGKNEIIAGDMGGYIHAWKTDGISTAIEWGRSRFDTGFTGEYVSGYQDPLVITESTDWQGGPFVNDIIVRSGTLRIPSGKTLQMPDACRLYVLDGGTLEVDAGVIANADILIKDGGTLQLVNNGTIYLNRFGEVDTELGAQVEMQSGEIRLGNE